MTERDDAPQDFEQAFTIEAMRRRLEHEAARRNAERRLNNLLFPTELMMAD